MIKYGTSYNVKTKDGILMPFKITLHIAGVDLSWVVPDDPNKANGCALFTLIHSTGELEGTGLFVEYETQLELPIGLPIIKCDCGGYKTYNTTQREYHSYWCSIYE
jgi:hypothetical protein